MPAEYGSRVSTEASPYKKRSIALYAPPLRQYGDRKTQQLTPEAWDRGRIPEAWDRGPVPEAWDRGHVPEAWDGPLTPMSIAPSYAPQTIWVLPEGRMRHVSDSKAGLDESKTPKIDAGTYLRNEIMQQRRANPHQYQRELVALQRGLEGLHCPVDVKISHREVRHALQRWYLGAWKSSEEFRSLFLKGDRVIIGALESLSQQAAVCWTTLTSRELRVVTEKYRRETKKYSHIPSRGLEHFPPAPR